VDCNGFDVILSNADGAAEAVFTVTGPDGSDRDITVPAGEETTASFPVTEDEERTVTVRHDGEELASRSYTADCILGEEASRPPVTLAPDQAGSPAALPQTGAPASMQWTTFVALLMLCFGGALIASRRFERG
jgi:LPXTG-motif cell wall-anchored protein